MFTSVRLSQLVLRLGLAAVFLWFGIDKFVQPVYWLQAWVPPWVLPVIGKLSLSGEQFIYINGIFEVLVGLSLITTLFMRTFAGLAVIFLLSVMIFVGIGEVTVRDFGLIGGLLALFFWPDNSRRF